jgi:hypothetical protein
MSCFTESEGLSPYYQKLTIDLVFFFDNDYDDVDFLSILVDLK